MFLFIVILGSVPSQLCNDVLLNTLQFQTNPLTCYASCLTSKSGLNAGSVPRCPTSQELGLCGFIAATNIQSKSGYSMWSCDVNGLPTSDPCGNSPTWLGLSCSGGAVTSISLNSIGLSGMV